MPGTRTPWEANGGNFIIGVDAQPIENMDAWKARGCNTLVRADLQGRFSLATWASKAGALGFRTIRDPLDVALDLNDKTLLAYALPDEADTSNHWYGVRPAEGWPAGVTIWKTITAPDGRKYDLVGRDYGPAINGVQKRTGATWQTTAEAYALMADAARANNTGLPIFGNFAGNYVTQNDPRPEYSAFTAPLDWHGNDWHVIDKDPTAPEKPRRYQLWWPGWATARLISYSGGKPGFTYIESSNQNREAGRRWPTKSELWVEVFSAICQGTSGIIYFPQRWGHKTADGKSGFYADGPGAAAASSLNPADAEGGAAIVEAITEINATIKRINLYLTSGNRTLENPAAGVLKASWSLIDGRAVTITVNANPVAAKAVFGGELPAYYVGIDAPAPEPIPGGGVSRAEFDAYTKAFDVALSSVGATSRDAKAQAADAATKAADAVARCLDAAAAMQTMAKTLLAMADALNAAGPRPPAIKREARNE